MEEVSIIIISINYIHTYIHISVTLVTMYPVNRSKEKNVLLQAGVCLKVPFNRVTINKSREPAESNEMVDFAGVS